MDENGASIYQPMFSMVAKIAELCNVGEAGVGHNGSELAHPTPTPTPLQQQGKRREWCEETTLALIAKYGELYWNTTARGGDIRPASWDEVADEVNAAFNNGTCFSASQCHNKWTSLRKRLTKERTKMSTTMSPSSWPFYEAMESAIARCPRTPLAFTEVIELDDDSDDDLDIGDGAVSKKRGGDSEKDGGDPRGKRAKKRGCEGGVEKLAASIGLLTQTVKEIEEKRLEQMDKMVQAQLQVAKLFGPRHGRDEVAEVMGTSIGLLAQTMKEVELKRVQQMDRMLDLQLQIGRAFCTPTRPQPYG